MRDCLETQHSFKYESRSRPYNANSSSSKVQRVSKESYSIRLDSFFLFSKRALCRDYILRYIHRIVYRKTSSIGFIRIIWLPTRTAANLGKLEKKYS